MTSGSTGKSAECLPASCLGGVRLHEVQLSVPVLVLQLEWPYSWVVNGEDFASDKSRYAAGLAR